MFNAVAFTVIAALASLVSGLVVPRREPPPGWAKDALEPYNTYHTRYLALNCQGQHGTQFFDDCCHPLQASQSLTDRKPECTPGSQSAPAPPECTEDPDGGNADPPAPSASSTDDGNPNGQPTDAPAPPPSSTPDSTPSPTTDAPAPPPPAPTDAGNNKQQPPPSGGGAGNNDGELNLGGFATFYEQNGQAGACGDFHSDNDLIAAMDERRYGSAGGRSELCGKQVLITNEKNGKTVTVTVADDCPTCANNNSIDLSHAAFNQIADPVEGMVPIKWKFL